MGPEPFISAYAFLAELDHWAALFWYCLGLLSATTFWTFVMMVKLGQVPGGDR